ncbi:MAG: hypothetical protein A2Y59_06425 [Chloroflexi bacterium RBG_13_52_14]|nr:MAG: hypothetical protein A2Y59_06425 [Chloroflexi bacterium RBG_13_52_14]
MRSIDKDPDGVYNTKGGLGKKNGGAGRLSSGQTDNKNQRYQKVEFLTSFLGLPFPGLPQRATKDRETRSTKGGGLTG